MKKLIVLLTSVLVLFAFAFTGCVKQKGTLALDNYVTTSMYVTLGWTNGSYSVGSLGYSTYDVDPGSGTANCYTSGGSFWASTSTSVYANQTTTLYIYQYKSTSGTEIHVSQVKPEGLTK